MIMVQRKPNGLFIQNLHIPNSARVQGVAGRQTTARTLHVFVIYNVRQFTYVGTLWVSNIQYVPADAWSVFTTERQIFLNCDV